MPLDVDRLRQARPDTPIHYFPTVSSTMQVATLLAAQGAPHGTVAVADEQTAGQGRLGRSWISDPEVGIYCSVLLRLPLPPAQIPIATLLLGLATADAIQKTTDLACDLRWPNDVLIRERKVAGILAQFTHDCVIAGIGINVNQTEMPNDLRTPATSIRMETRKVPPTREALLIAVLNSLDDFASVLEHDGPSAILSAFNAASSYARNRRVIVEDMPHLKGTTIGLDENGFLLIRTDSGAVERIPAGGVRASH